MKTLAGHGYRQNRAKITFEELRKLDGKWVAFSPNAQQILASAPTIQELSDAVRELGEDLRHVVLEHIEIDSTDINLGSAELP